MKEFIIDGRKMTTQDELFKHLSELMWFPNYFGNNIDALWDILTQVSDETEIHFINVDIFLDEMDTYALKVIRMFKMLDYQMDNYTVHFYPGEMTDDY